MNTCAKCGNAVAEGKKFCSACGERLVSTSTLVTSEYTTVQTSSNRRWGYIYAIIGIVGSLLLLTVILWPVFTKARVNVKPICVSNQRRIVLTIQLYSQEHDEMLPESLAQVQASLSPKDLHCPSATTPISYGYNKTLAQKDLSTLNAPEMTMLTADSAHELITLPSDIDVTRHHGGYYASFADGHVDFKSN